MSDVLTERMCFDTSLARGEGGASVWRSAILRRSAWAIRATTAGVRCFSLLTVLVYVTDEYPTAYAGVGAQGLQTGVVRLYSVVVILNGWVRIACARLSGVHSL